MNKDTGDSTKGSDNDITALSSYSAVVIFNFYYRKAAFKNSITSRDVLAISFQGNINRPKEFAFTN
jgi:hypothetical protein